MTKHFAGLSGLAHEVPTKKITSEEETFSGQRLLIFQHNWTGIYSQFEPFSPVVEEENADVAHEVTDSYKAAKEIVQASYRYRDALLEAQKTLKPSN